MIRFPLLSHLSVRGFPLYPGPCGDHVMELNLDDGAWMILGVNGLGKSTLLLMMRYLLTGAVRLREAGFAGERADLTAMPSRFFAVRVQDDARGAHGTLTVSLGDNTLIVTRDLASLALIEAKVKENGQSRVLTTEADYRATVARLMNLAQFEDAVRVFDYVTFFPEQRMPLIWDLAAQFELFRGILTPDTSAELRQREGEIISADSAARNLNAGIAKVIKRRETEAKKTRQAHSTKARLAAAQAGYDEALKGEAKLVAEIETLEEQRDDALLEVKRAERDVDDTSREYEKLKYDALKAAFEGVPPTEQYVFLRLLTDKICMVCEQDATIAATELRDRLAKNRCPVCGNGRHTSPALTQPVEDIRDAADEAYVRLLSAKELLDEVATTHTALRSQVAAKESRLSQLREEAQTFSGQIRVLRRQLPLEDAAALEEEERRLAALREQVTIFRQERELAEEQIESLIAGLKEATEQIRVALEDRFNAVAKPFFAERVRLIYAPRETRIGQQGKTFLFPAFEIDMTSGASQGQFVRRRIEQVSLSQREYLDLIFRMALIDVLGGAAGTLAIDGPEGSVDAVFAERAGDLFASFASQPGKSVVLASNIVEGGFIPNTLRNYAPNPRSRVINLLDQAVPTAALNQLKNDYLRKVDEIMLRRPT
ncbi:Chromosome partition protein Smc [compost metagenome]